MSRVRPWTHIRNLRASASPLSSPPPNIMSQSDDDDDIEDWDSYGNHPCDGNLDTEALRDIDTAHSTYRTQQSCCRHFKTG